MSANNESDLRLESVVVLGKLNDGTIRQVVVKKKDLDSIIKAIDAICGGIQCLDEKIDYLEF